MGKRNKKRINYKRLRGYRSSKRVNIEVKRLEKLEKAIYRRKLKVNINLRLKKLTRMVNLKSQYLGK
jgi:uncharacterized protein YggE